MGKNLLHQQIQSIREKLHTQIGAGQESIEIEMDSLLKQKKEAEEAAEYIIQEIVAPAMDVVYNEFENVEIKAQKHRIECYFLHTKKMPASGKIAFTHSLNQYFAQPVLEFSGELHPVFITVEKQDQLNLVTVLNDSNENNIRADEVQNHIRTWVDFRITTYLEKYIAIEYHPIYQKENFVTDPVCGMRFVKASAKVVSKDKNKKLEIYFCSHKCYDTWQGANGWHE